MIGEVVQWGFLVEEAGKFSGVSGSTVLVRSLRPSDNIEIERRVQAFARLANLGGLCGESFDPRSSGLDGARVRIEPDGVVLAFDHARVDPHAYKILLNVLDDSDLGISGVRFALALPPQAYDLTTARYPGRWPNLPFTLQGEAKFKNTLCEVIFHASIEDKDAVLVWNAVEAWAYVAVLGGFREWYRPRAESVASWPENEKFDQDRLTFELGFIDCDDAAIDSLINLFAKLALSMTPIAELYIG